MKYLITGHTGFKGSWLVLLLQTLGHSVHGLSLPPEKESLYNILDLKAAMNSETFSDIRNFGTTKKYFEDVNPEVVIHLAAQALVNESYLNPIETIDTNTVGTFNVLKAAENLKNLKCVLIVTTDKVYRIDGRTTPYFETDSLGYTDPYGTSKAAADLIAQSWIHKDKHYAVGIARAGNVIGGGDFGKFRLIPDIYRSLKTKIPVEIRHPESIRPWQFVLDCLNGYLKFVNFMIESKSSDILNFGPDERDFKNVDEVIQNFSKYFRELKWLNSSENRFKETSILKLDSSKARNLLSWKNKYGLQKNIENTANWFSAYMQNQTMKKYSQEIINDFI